MAGVEYARLGEPPGLPGSSARPTSTRALPLQLRSFAIAREDKAVAEGLFGSLKIELIGRRPCPTRGHIADAGRRQNDAFYDAYRLHSTLGQRTPAEVEKAPYRLAQAPRATHPRKRNNATRWGSTT